MANDVDRAGDRRLAWAGAILAKRGAKCYSLARRKEGRRRAPTVVASQVSPSRSALAVAAAENSAFNRAGRRHAAA